MTQIGHNSRIGNVSVEKLKSYVERIERLLEDKADIAADVREVKAEAKANGFDTQAVMAIIKLRAMDAEKRREKEDVIDTYRRALQLDLFDGGGE